MSAQPLPERLVEHLRGWVGAWPPQRRLHVVANPRRAEPGWDGAVVPVTGVATAAGDAVVGVDPALAPPVAAFAATSASTSTSTSTSTSGDGDLDDVDALIGALPGLLGRPGVAGRGVFRWSVSPAPLPDAGVWLPFDDPRVPPWLRPFGGDVLVALDGDSYVAGVGVKRHDERGHELAVGTDEHARGRGLARRLVAQAARRVLDEGAVPTYLHAPDNVASARAATAAGFPDLGWSVVGFWPAP